jgi:hypothetical protein
VRELNIYTQLTTWLTDCPESDSYIFFNVIPVEVDATAVTTVPNLRSTQEFMDGSVEVTELFNINLVKEYDPAGTSDINLLALQAFENITTWIEEKSNKGELPNVIGITINSIQPSYTVPDIYLNEDTGNVRYEGRYEINYLERRI